MVISFLVLALIYSSPSTFNVFGAPPSDPPGAACWTHATGGPGQYTTTCCWTETDPADPEGIEIDYCQHCDYDPSTQTQEQDVVIPFRQVHQIPEVDVYLRGTYLGLNFNKIHP